MLYLHFTVLVSPSPISKYVPIVPIAKKVFDCRKMYVKKSNRTRLTIDIKSIPVCINRGSHSLQKTLYLVRKQNVASSIVSICEGMYFVKKL